MPNNKNQPIASLNPENKHHEHEINEIAITRCFPVVNESEMLSLNAQVGDICKRNDERKTRQ